MIASAVKRLLYYSGALGAYHRIRNRETLTVVMFHRVLSPADVRWQECDPRYTVSDSLFADYLAFFRKHYHVVSLAQVLAARESGSVLPPRALLITFDDGWADTADYALPRLREVDMPAIVFVVSDVVDRAEPFFQEQIMGAWRSGELSPGTVVQIWRALGKSPPDYPGDQMSLEPIRALISELELLSPESRESLMLRFMRQPSAPSVHMLRKTQLRDLLDGAVAIGSHGKTHTPLPQAPHMEGELRISRATLGALSGSPPPDALSFPHGKFNRDIVDVAGREGYKLMFTSQEYINRTRPKVAQVLGRVGASAEYWVRSDGRLAPERLALDYFRRPRGPVHDSMRTS